MVEIRLFCEQDLDDIYEHHFQAMQECNCCLESTDLPMDLKDIREQYTLRRGVFAVAVYNADVVGMGGLFLSEANAYEVRHLFVQKSFRGMQIGLKLLEFLLSAEMREVNDKISAITKESMHVVQGLLKRTGFKAVARVKRCGEDYVLFQR